MKYTYALALVALLCGLCAHAQQPLYSPETPLSSITRNALSNYVGPTSRMSLSCSSSNVTVYGPHSAAVAFSRSKSSAITAAAKNCKDAVVKAFVGSQGEDGTCGATDAHTLIFAAASSCARAAMELRTDAYGIAASRGAGAAMTQACAWSAASSASMARAIVEGFAEANAAMSDDNAYCSAMTGRSMQALLNTTSAAATTGLAMSFVRVGTVGHGSAEARAASLFKADVAVYARIMGTVSMHVCGNCGNKCTYCSTYVNEGINTNTESYAAAAGARHALAGAASEVMAGVCKAEDGADDDDAGLNSQTIFMASKAILQAVAQVCIQATARVCGVVSASGNAVACTKSVAIGNINAMNEMYGNLVTDAFAAAFSADECVTKAFMSAAATIKQHLHVQVFLAAMQSECAVSNSYERTQKTASYTAAANRVVEALSNEVGAALADAASGAYSSCGCENSAYCSPDCPPEERHCPSEQAAPY